jgi:hypothetical protein
VFVQQHEMNLNYPILMTKLKLGCGIIGVSDLGFLWTNSLNQLGFCHEN